MGVKIGWVARRCKVSRDTIRYYERLGLLEPEVRTQSGHRLFSEESIHRLSFIRSCQRLGLTLENIGELLRFQTLAPAEARERTAGLLRERIGLLGEQIDLLLATRRGLEEKLALCERASGAARLLEVLADPEGTGNETR